MTVAELIAELQKLPKDDQIFAEYDASQYIPVIFKSGDAWEIGPGSPA